MLTNRYVNLDSAFNHSNLSRESNMAFTLQFISAR